MNKTAGHLADKHGDILYVLQCRYGTWFLSVSSPVVFRNILLSLFQVFNELYLYRVGIRLRPWWNRNMGGPRTGRCRYQRVKRDGRIVQTRVMDLERTWTEGSRSSSEAIDPFWLKRIPLKWSWSPGRWVSTLEKKQKQRPTCVVMNSRRWTRCYYRSSSGMFYR